MHSRLGHHGDHGRRCRGIEHGRLGGSDRDSLREEMGAGSGRPLRGSRYSRDGEAYGWGREGRFRLDDPLCHQRRLNLRGSLMGGLRGLNLGRRLLSGGGFSGGGSPLGGVGGWGTTSEDPYDGLGNRRSPYLDRALEAALLYRDSPYLRSGLRLNDPAGLMSQDRLAGSSPYLNGGAGLGMDLEGSRSPYFRGSGFSLNHLDRRPRPYHYQPPYVEGYESILEEELLGDLIELAERRGEGADMYGLPGRYELEDLIGEMGIRRSGL